MRFLPVLLILPLLALSSFFYFSQATSFDFIDEYYNILAGYFMRQGYGLYSDIFWNHHPGMADLSWLLQSVLQPENLNRHVTYHRLFMIGHAVLSSILLTLRFRWRGAAFVAIYEFIKYYTFGFTFQAEGYIVYSVVYLMGLIWEVYNKRKLWKGEYLIALFCAAGVVNMREVYAPLALLMYGFLLLKLPDRKKAVLYGVGAVVLSIAPLLRFNLQEYYHQMISVNSSTVIAADVNMYGGPLFTILRIIGYPVYILLSNNYSHFHIFQIVLSISFILLVANWIRLKKNLVIIPVLLLILAAAAIRPHPAGEAFYGAYRMVVWTSLFIFAIVLLLESVKKYYKAVFGLALLIVALLPSSYIWQGFPNRADKYFVSYSQYTEPGEVMKILSSPEDTLFVDGYGALVYMVSEIKPATKYIFHFPVQKKAEPYASLKKETFATNPPDFYFTTCHGNDNQYALPASSKAQYIPLKKGGKATCTFVHKAKAATITEEQKEKIAFFSYEL